MANQCRYIIVLVSAEYDVKRATMSGRCEELVLLFSYGTLRQPNVQLAIFGRLVEGRPDTLPGFALSPLAITDPDVIATSGTAVHTIARPTGNPSDQIPGFVFSITPEELEAADRYEVSDCTRILVRLASGAEAFVYVGD